MLYAVLLITVLSTQAKNPRFHRPNLILESQKIPGVLSKSVYWGLLGNNAMIAESLIFYSHHHWGQGAIHEWPWIRNSQLCASHRRWSESDCWWWFRLNPIHHHICLRKWERSAWSACNAMPPVSFPSNQSMPTFGILTHCQHLQCSSQVSAWFHNIS